MPEFPHLVRIRTGGGFRMVNVRAAPTTASADLGDLAAGQALRPIGISRDDDWYAIEWDGASAWVLASLTEPLGEAPPPPDREPRAQPAPQPAPEPVPGAGLAFDWPVGTTAAERGGRELPRGWYVAIGFDQEYRPSPGERAVHTGLDINLSTGGDTDLDAPVYACADGVVTASGSYPVWGNIVLLRHALPDGGTLWSQYAHLNRRLAATGRTVRRGEQIGTVGKGEGGRFLAHLHFEIRTRDLSPAYWPGMDHTAIRAGYRDPRTVLGDRDRISASSRSPRSTWRPAGAGYPMMGVWDVPAEPLLEEMVARGGGWVGLTVGIGYGAEGAPNLDLTPLTERGLRVVVQFVPKGVRQGVRQGEPAVLPPIERLPAWTDALVATVEIMAGCPWAILVAGSFNRAGHDGTVAWRLPPRGAAEAFNLAYVKLRHALGRAGFAEARVGPGALDPAQAGIDAADEAGLVAYWQEMLDWVADTDVLAVRARTFGLVAPPDGAHDTAPSGLADPFNLYRAQLAAVPERLRRRPALLAGVDPTEPWRDVDTGWVRAAASNVRNWNLDGSGPRVAGLLLHRWSAPGDAGLAGKPAVLADLRAAWDLLAAPVASEDISPAQDAPESAGAPPGAGSAMGGEPPPGAPTGAPQRADRRQTAAERLPEGKGLFVAKLWDVDGGDGAAIARRAHGLGLGFLVVKAAHRDRPYVLGGGVDHAARAAGVLRAAGPALWGWGAIAGAAPELEAAVAIERLSALGVTGWVVEPLPGYPPEAALRFLRVLRPAARGMPLALLLDPADEAMATAFGPAVDVLMPRLTGARAGQVEIAVAVLARFGRPVVPVLALWDEARPAPQATAEPPPDEGVAFLRAAHDDNRPGAALLAWDSCLHSADGLAALRDTARFRWRGAGPTPDGPAQPAAAAEVHA